VAFRKIQATNLNSVETSFTDSIMVLNKAGTTGQDVGWLGKTSGSTYSGIIKDGDDGNFYLINNVTLGSQQVNDVNPASITKGHFVVDTITANTYAGLTVSISGLSDVNSADTPATSDMLLYDGSQWNYVNYEDEINTRITANNNSLTLTGLSDVGGTDTAATGDMVLYDGSEWSYINFETQVTTYADSRVQAAFTNDVALTGTFTLPKGTTAQRPGTPSEGMMYFNTETKMFEGYDGTNWVQLVPSTFTETP
jgi:hypothetical protein